MLLITLPARGRDGGRQD